MVKRLVADISRQTSYMISSDLKSQQLGDYYFQFEADPQKLNRLIVAFDDLGVPMNTGYIDVENPSLHYYPISIGQYGLALYSAYLKDSDETKRNQFLNIADWFLNNRHEHPDLGTYWLTEIPKPEYKVLEPWKSAFAQSRALSVLLRAWQLTGKENYFTPCPGALVPFTFDITDDGVTANLHTGYPFYEEYVAAEPTMVLDGHLFSLFGIYDYIRAVSASHPSHTLAQKIFTGGIKGLKHWLPEFDLGYWVRFNLCRMAHYPKIDPCTIGYLKLIIAQLQVIEQIHPDKQISIFRKRFQNYDHKLNYIKMYPLKYKALKGLNRV